VKLIAIFPAAFLLLSPGCRWFRPSAPVSEEVRHPSNEMNVPEPEAAPARREVRKLASVKRAPARQPRHAPGYEDPRHIPAGIEYSEMVRRFGPPSMKITDSPSRTTFSYSTLQTQVQVEVQSGKVVSVAAINTGF